MDLKDMRIRGAFGDRGSPRKSVSVVPFIGFRWSKTWHRVVIPGEREEERKTISAFAHEKTTGGEESGGKFYTGCVWGRIMSDISLSYQHQTTKNRTSSTLTTKAICIIKDRLIIVTNVPPTQTTTPSKETA